MKKTSPPPSLKKIKTISLRKRPSKVTVNDFGTPHQRGKSFTDFLKTLPHLLAAKDFKDIVQRVVKARHRKKPIIFGIGAHVIKVGLNPLLIDLMQRGIISCLAMNGAGAIHDVEIALAGKTSEDVSPRLQRGTFGMSPEAAQVINQAVKKGLHYKWGMGEAIGRHLLELSPPYLGMSLLAAAARNNIVSTVHVSIGTDTIHLHPSFDGAATGKLSHKDFTRFSQMVSQLEGGVYFNIGSAVILPEVFLKAIALNSNLKRGIKNLTTVNMDFIRHYRPSVNVVERPTAQGGKGYHLIGHHEIMLPLLAAAIVETL